MLASSALLAMLLAPTLTVVDADRADVERRARAVDEAEALYRQRAGARTRALHHLVAGGDARRFAEPPSVEQRSARVALLRVLRRDLDERAKYRAERGLLAEERAAIDRRASAWMARRAESPAPPPPLARPVKGSIVGGFGRVRESSGLERERRGVLLQARPGEVVSSPLGATCHPLGELPGLGPALLLRGAHDVSVVLAPVTGSSCAGGPVSQRAPLGKTGGGTLYVELRRHGAPVDPAPALRR